eukprot:gnl/MRDRNA2_/MRDRNA2_43854_c0_seq1.p1 gnl/MRDRNA2_/MRDRNA2_43854_c0~~gnl/MRDRNA2_/MRDRNA2_43854_c0_seq1.p1  ORF type:complete len:915 (+),score=172.92 gnl/MRDRNA2_/MRDRNA2_43854_c0_seq1:123-2867(+)
MSFAPPPPTPPGEHQRLLPEMQGAYRETMSDLMGIITAGKSKGSAARLDEKISSVAKLKRDRNSAIAIAGAHNLDSRRAFKQRVHVPDKALFEKDIKSLSQVRHHSEAPTRKFPEPRTGKLWNPCGSACEWKKHPDPFGPSSFKIEKRLEDRVQQINRELRFDAMVRTDGTFKRQVWADMMRDGVIGGDAQRSSGLKEREWGAEGFRKLLARRHGSMTRGWRLALDIDRKGRVSFVEFCQAAREIGYEGPLRRLWAELAGEGAFITLDRIDPVANKRLGTFRDLLWRSCGGIREAWKFFDVSQRRRLNLVEFKKRCAALGLVPTDMALASGVEGAGWDSISGPGTELVKSRRLSKRRGAGAELNPTTEADRDFQELRSNIDQLFDDLDANGHGLVSWLEFCFLESWLSDADLRELETFRSFMLKKFKSAREVCDALGPHITLPVFTAFCEKHGYYGEPSRMFSVMDQDGDGSLSGSEIIRVFAALPPTSSSVKPVSLYNPMPAIASTLAASKGIDLDRNAIQSLGRPIQASFFIYDREFKKIEDNPKENQDLKKIMNIKDEDAGPECLQPEPCLEHLLVQAEEAQNSLKSKISASKSVWYQRNVCPQPVSWVDAAYDPGIKAKARVEAKAAVKYAVMYRDQKYRRVRDISRMALQFNSCASMLNAIKKCKEVFEVVMVENRMRVPTALGWRDVTILVKEPLKSGSYHICEIQFQLLSFAQARKEAHKHYTALRELLPKLFPGDSAAALEEVTHQILDGLTATVRSFSFDTGNVACNMERGKSWTMDWKQNPIVAYEPDAFPDKRPTMAISAKNSEWIDRERTKIGPVVPELTRGRPWQPVMIAKPYFGVFEPDAACIDMSSTASDKGFNKAAQTHGGSTGFGHKRTKNPRQLPGSKNLHTQSATSLTTLIDEAL